MSDYYVDPGAIGDNDGGGDGVALDPTDSANWTHAWTSLQSAADAAVAGDTVFCRGTQTLSVKIDFDTNSGNPTGNGMIRFIGVAANGDWDGTRFVLDGNNTALYCIDDINANFVGFENFELKRATSHGWFDGSSNPDLLGMYYNNCSFNNNGGRGFWGDDLDGGFFYRCTAYNNGQAGFRIDTLNDMGVFLFCSSHDNTGDGFYVTACQFACVGCLSFDNGNNGIEGHEWGNFIFNSVIDRNANNGVNITASDVNKGPAIVFGTRITNHSGVGDIGINSNSNIFFHGHNYYEDNDGNNIQNGSIAIEVLDDGVATEVEDQGDTNQGYVSNTDGSEDYNLRDDATKRRTVVTIPTS